MYKLISSNKNRIIVQIATWFTAISLLPLFVATYLNFINARKELSISVSENLKAISQRQANEIDSYLSNHQNFISILALTSDVVRSMVVLNRIEDSKFLETYDATQIEELKKSFTPILRGFVDQFDFKQMILIGPEGKVNLSIGDTSFPYAHLEDPALESSNVKEVFEYVMMFMSPQISHFSRIEGSDSLGFYLAAPVLNEGKLVGVIALQIDASYIFKITQDYTGLGYSGETLIATKDANNEMVVINPTRHLPQAQPFQNITRLNLKDHALEEALKGNRGVGQKVDYRNEKVFAAWEFMPKINWGLVVKEDKAEAYIPVTELRSLSLFIGTCTLILVISGAILLAGSISQPIVALTQVTSRIALGDLTPNIDKAPSNEIGLLSNAIRDMASNLKSLVNKVKNSGVQVASTSQDVFSTVQQQLSIAEETGRASVDISESARKISITAKDLTGTMQEVSEVAQDTALLAESGIDGLQIMENSMGDLSEANIAVSKQLTAIQEKADAIGGIITTMTKVADRTNLLSLNAAIEARKAGEYGKGFKVVAAEIRNLADQAARSTLEIEAMVKEMLEAVQKGVFAIHNFSDKVEYGIREITTVSKHLANVIQQVQGLPPRFVMVFEGMQSQAKDADKIKQAIELLSSSAQKTVKSLKGTSHKLELLEKTSQLLKKEISRFQTE